MPDDSTFRNVRVTTNSKGRQVVLINGCLVRVSEVFYAAERMAVIQKVGFPEDENASLSIIGDLGEVRDDATEEDSRRHAASIDKKWDGVRLVKSQQWSA